MMEFSGEFTVDGTPEELWKYFTDPDILLDCAPGCNKLELRSPSHIVAGLAVGVGSVKPSFDVEGFVTECDRPNRLEIQATGEASRNSFKATASQELHDNGDGTTTVKWRAETEISGIIASMGERAIGSVTNKLVNEFFQDLEGHVNAGTPAESKLQAASTEEIEAAEEMAAEARAAGGAGGGLTGRAIGKAVEVTGGEGSGAARSFAAGVALGVLGSSLWRRLRGRRGQRVGSGRAPADGSTPAGNEEAVYARSVPAGSGDPSLLTLGLTAALGAAGAIIWSQSRSEDATESTVTPTTTGTGDTEDVASASVAGDGQATAGSEADEPTVASGAESDNPLDRLESRP